MSAEDWESLRGDGLGVYDAPCGDPTCPACGDGEYVDWGDDMRVSRWTCRCGVTKHMEVASVLPAEMRLACPYCGDSAIVLPSDWR